LSRARSLIGRFSCVADTWRLSREERSRVVGLPGETSVETLLPWAIDSDLLTRVQLIVQIWLLLHQRVEDPALSRRWLRTRMDCPPFAGRAALDLMMRGQAHRARDYLGARASHIVEAEIRRACGPPGGTTAADGFRTTFIARWRQQPWTKVCLS